jgi:catechol-2,3-dioxygenase
MYAYLPARDVPRARSFYEQKIGFQPKEENAGGVVYEFADHTGAFRTLPTRYARLPPPGVGDQSG